MINEYYGVASTPNKDFLAHYGVRGMKWGVQKAIHKGTEKAMNKQYRKAKKKLEKLNKQADISSQKNEMEYHKRKMTRSAIAAGAVLGASLPIAAAAGNHKVVHTNTNNGHSNVAHYPRTNPGVYVPALIATKGIQLGVLGKTGYHVGKYIAAKKRTTTVGHDKAVAKRDAWAKEMKSAFRGTQYDASTGSIKKRRKSR